MSAQTNLDRAHAYLKLLERQSWTPELEALFAPEMTHREYPNRLNPQGRTATVTRIRENLTKSPDILHEQRYTVRKSIVQGDEVALEVDWAAVLKVKLGELSPGQTMRASFGMFLTFREGRIVSQRNYDCFEPF